jgi:hypothetical protein
LQLDAAAADRKPDAVAADWRVDVAATAAGTRPAATAAETVYCSDGGCRGLQRWGGVACREGGGDRVLLRRRRQRQCTGWKTVVASEMELIWELRVSSLLFYWALILSVQNQR